MLRLLLFISCCGAALAGANTLEGVRLHEAPDHTRVVLDTSAAADYDLFTLADPERVVIDLKQAKARDGFDPAVVGLGRQRIEAVRGAHRSGGYRLVIELKETLRPNVFKLAPVAPHGHRLVIDLYGASKRQVAPRRAPRTDREIVIAVDAGHGGDDPGAIAANKQREKNVVLQISRRVAKGINDTPGFRAVMVRTGDYYISLRKRMEIAREARADLFV